MPRPVAPIGSPGPGGPRATAVPIPYIVLSSQNLGVLDDATSDSRAAECVRDRLCQICGVPLADEAGYGIANGVTPSRTRPIENGFNGHSLMHRDCLQVALVQCPAIAGFIARDLITLVVERRYCRYMTRGSVLHMGVEIDVSTPADWEIVVRRGGFQDSSGGSTQAFRDAGFVI